MPSPFIQFRLPRPEMRRLRVISKLCGSVSPSLFCRDLLRASFAQEGPGPFLQKVGTALGREQQRQLELALQEGVARGSGRARGGLTKAGQ